MKIAKLETFANEFVCFVKLTTDTGDVGWGQTSTYNADVTARIFHRQVAPWALGAVVPAPAIPGDSAIGIEALVERIEEREHKFPGSYRCRAIAGLDTALWDLHGKLAGKPIVELLGGTPARLRAYASSMKRDISPEDEAARLVRLRAWRPKLDCPARRTARICPSSRSARCIFSARYQMPASTWNFRLKVPTITRGRRTSSAAIPSRSGTGARRFRRSPAGACR
jgi:L-alanine-DL-glutamate epimerase-like enolase superfamily enzyme